MLLPHSFRHFDQMFLAPGATSTGIPPRFAFPAALGDLIATVLSLVSILAIATGHRSGRILVWVLNAEGSLDLLATLILTAIYDASLYMGAAYWVPSFWVPALWMTHYITFVIL